jgi:MoaA/NifB/PqqE/SkfB family radical SAM enzyme
MGPTGNHPSLQIHPTRRCNLRCLHCYSSSGPQERDELPFALLRDALDAAASEGFRAVGFSGGEPTMYAPLGALLKHAHHLGMITAVTSNGMLAGREYLDSLDGCLDLLAISLDGVPASHNRMRANGRAFAAMEANLEAVRASGIPFGFLFTLTQHNLNELRWVAEFALGQGAKLLQIHPLEEAGRAAQLLATQVPDEIECSFAYLAVAQLQQVVGERLYVQLDLAHRDHLCRQPERILADESDLAGTDVPFAQLVSPLIIEADGTVVPIQHGFPRLYALGDLNEAPLHDLMAAWRRDLCGPFRRLCRDVFEEMLIPAELPLSNWYELVARRAAARTPLDLS